MGGLSSEIKSVRGFARNHAGFTGSDLSGLGKLTKEGLDESAYLLKCGIGDLISRRHL